MEKQLLPIFARSCVQYIRPHPPHAHLEIANQSAHWFSRGYSIRRVLHQKSASARTMNPESALRESPVGTTRASSCFVTISLNRPVDAGSMQRTVADCGGATGLDTIWMRDWIRPLSHDGARENNYLLQYPLTCFNLYLRIIYFCRFVKVQHGATQTHHSAQRPIWCG